jgi:hypothetical protein
MEKNTTNLKKPIIYAYFLCYNEATILPHLLKYYLTFCDKVFILDNGSTDNSIKIVNSFPNTEVIRFNSNGEFRDDVHIQIKNNIWKNHRNEVDYVILGDADEFLYHNNIVDFLTEKFNQGYTIFKPFGYHMVGDIDLELSDNDNIFEKIKDGVRTPVLDKMMIFDCKKIREINYSYGCHFANPQGEVKLYNGEDLKMVHYKFLGLQNHMYKHKIRKERLSEFNKKNNLGTYYLFTEEEQIKDYKGYLDKRKKVL